MSVSISKPTVGASNGTWGTEANAVFDALNAADYFRVKTADQSLTSVGTLTDDTHLAGIVLPVGTFLVNATYLVSGALAADAQFAWAFSGTAVNSWRSGQGPASTTTSSTVGTIVRTAASGNTASAITSASPYGTDNASISCIQETGVLTVTAGGTFKVQWSQLVSTASATLHKAGSFVWLRQVA